VRYLHTMVRVTNLEESLDFYCNKLGLRETHRTEHAAGRFTLVFVAPPGQEDRPLELTFNWDPETYDEGRNFGHVAFEVDDIYATCERLQQQGVTINRPPRDGRMAFIRSPDQISIELLQKGSALPPREPWSSMPSSGRW
jgi:lactoylglutathione lyase